VSVLKQSGFEQMCSKPLLRVVSLRGLNGSPRFARYVVARLIALAR